MKTISLYEIHANVKCVDPTLIFGIFKIIIRTQITPSFSAITNMRKLSLKTATAKKYFKKDQMKAMTNEQKKNIRRVVDFGLLTWWSDTYVNR